jgi:BTB/POZ domain
MAPVPNLHSEDTAHTAFGPPFDDIDADVILRSSDQVDFHVYKIILSKASPLFKDMFTLPQPSGADTPQTPHVVVNMSESSQTLSVLLSVIYPHTSETAGPPCLSDYLAALEAARKYDMTTASRRLLQDFENAGCVQDSPVEAFCAAYTLKLGDAARVAAKASLQHRLNLDNIGDKLEQMNGPALLRLWRYHRACSAAAVTLIPTAHLTPNRITVTNLPWIEPAQISWWGLVDTELGCNRCASNTFKLGPPEDRIWRPHPSWFNYMSRARDTLREHPSSKAVTRHELLKPSYEELMCIECQRRICGLSEFSRYLGEEVDRRTAQVRWFTAFLDASLTFFSRRFIWIYHFYLPRRQWHCRHRRFRKHRRSRRPCSSINF